MNFNKSAYLISAITIILSSCKPISFDEPKVSLEAYHIVDGFDLEVVASEPFLEAPVSMSFDNKGRMWVVEMKGYMRNLEGTGDDLPNGVISILEDLDKDGITDHSKIFIDSLILPRAIAHVYGGLLYAEPPNLWFVDIKNDTPVNKILVDSLYSDGGNVEHQPNGLLMNIDNWIYNAKSNSRYQRKNGKWIKEPTTVRGQWGITRDNFGRLYYNNNSNLLFGDYVLPNTIIKNPYYKSKTAVNQKLTTNQRVYPLHPTSVNRGYSKGVLDKDSILVNVTSSCGPLIYRGNQFPDTYFQNAFICVPEANLIKRMILNFEENKTTGKHAWDNKEFIASTDEGFRPVNLFNGPDGNMYIVDMHRGIIQDKAFLTPYLQKHYAAKKLDTIIGMGRILQVSATNSTSNELAEIEKMTSAELVDLLNHSNPWLRDRAQQLLVLQNEKEALPLLKKILTDPKNPPSQIHALHTLNGMDALSFETLNSVLNSNSNSDTMAHAIVLLENFAAAVQIPNMLKSIEKLMLKNDPEIDFYIAVSLGKWTQLSPPDFFPELFLLSEKYPKNNIFQEGIINSLRGLESEFKSYLTQRTIEIQNTLLADVITTTIKNINGDHKNAIYTQTTVGTDSRTAGYKIFRNICATCHGVDGDGIDGLAPPLKGSEYVKGSTEQLALIILHGMKGPIQVNGKRYDLNLTMPGLANNNEYSDSDIANIISYLHNAFPSKSKNISSDQIKLLRTQKPKNGVFTEEELHLISN